MTLNPMDELRKAMEKAKRSHPRHCPVCLDMKTIDVMYRKSPYDNDPDDVDVVTEPCPFHREKP